MTSFCTALKCLQRKGLAYACMVALINICGFLYFSHYLFSHGYLPSPFLYYKADTFMDLFNVLYWVYDDGRYTDWGSVYPPLVFVVLKLVNFSISGSVFGSPELMREDSGLLITCFFLLYFCIPAAVLNTSYWNGFSLGEKVFVYLALICSSPMLFVLERGNLLLIAPVFLAFIVSKIGTARCFCIALLINIKPYFAILLLYYLARRNWRGLAVCSFIAGALFLVAGLWLDNNFLVFFSNLLNFSGDGALFSLREVMSLPSSISAFSYVLANPDGAAVFESLVNSAQSELIGQVVEVVKVIFVSLSLVSLFYKPRLMRDSEMFALLVVVISNFGVSVGGYTFVLYAALIPVLTEMRGRFVYIGLITLVALPWDVFPLMEGFIGEQYSYLSSRDIPVYWTLGLGALIRPLANIVLLFSLSIEFFFRRYDSVNTYRSNSPVEI